MRLIKKGAFFIMCWYNIWIFEVKITGNSCNVQGNFIFSSAHLTVFLFLANFVATCSSMAEDSTIQGLRLLPTFAGALRGKNRMRASFNKIPTNYILVESLINLLYKNNIILAMFSFSMCQEVVRRETTEGSSIEFIGYWIPQYEQNGCVVLYPIHTN